MEVTQIRIIISFTLNFLPEICKKSNRNQTFNFTLVELKLKN